VKIDIKNPSKNEGLYTLCCAFHKGCIFLG
jgi:hypothetical protein